MRNGSKTLATLTFALMLCSVSAFAQNPAAPARPGSASTDGVRPSVLDDKTTGNLVRASQLIGMNLQNSQGKSVGEINDIVLDAKTGKVRYAAVTYGGFLGMGDKLFAVPFAALKVRQNPDDPADAGDYVMVLDVTQAQLKGAVGFDQDHWPNMADENFVRDLHKRYGVDVDVHRGGVDVDIKRN